MNTSDPSAGPLGARRRVLEIQARLHRWARDDPHRRFDDLFNLVADPGFLLMAWDRVAGNKGARTAGVDGWTVDSVAEGPGVAGFLAGLRAELKARTFRPLPVRERMIPKPGTGKRRRLGIPTVADRVVQASLKLVLEPIFEADFQPCSHGFRPNRRAHDAVAETLFLASKTYEWVLEGDITACFDEISHPALMGRVRARIGDKQVLALVKAFLRAGILTESGAAWDTDTGTPQGGILSPLLAAYFRPGVSSRAFQHLRMIVWGQVLGWLRRKHHHAGWKELRRRYCDGGWWPRDGEVVLFNPGSVATTRYRPRGTTIPSPWPSTT